VLRRDVWHWWRPAGLPPLVGRARLRHQPPFHEPLALGNAAAPSSKAAVTGAPDLGSGGCHARCPAVAQIQDRAILLVGPPVAAWQLRRGIAHAASRCS